MNNKLKYAFDLEKQIEEKLNIKNKFKKKEYDDKLHFSKINVFVKDKHELSNKETTNSKNYNYSNFLKNRKDKLKEEEDIKNKKIYINDLKEQINNKNKEKLLDKNRKKEEELWYEKKYKKEMELVNERYNLELKNERRINTAYIKEQQKEIEETNRKKDEEKSSNSSIDKITNKKKKDVFISKPLIPKGNDDYNNLNNYDNISENISNYNNNEILYKRRSKLSNRNDIIDNVVSGYMSFKKSNYKQINNNLYDFKYKKDQLENNNINNSNNSNIINKIHSTLNNEIIRNKIYIPFNINNPTSIDSYKKFISFVNESKNINEDLLKFQNEINTKLDIINLDSKNVINNFDEKDYKNRYNQILKSPFLTDLIQINRNENYKQMIPEEEYELKNYLNQAKLDLSDLNKKVFNNSKPNFEVIKQNGNKEIYYFNKKNKLNT